MKVHVLTIEHEHGTNVYVCNSRAVAEQELLTYVKTWWGVPKDEEGKEIPIPEDPQEAIELYFDPDNDSHDLESYDISEEDVLE